MAQTSGLYGILLPALALFLLEPVLLSTKRFSFFVQSLPPFLSIFAVPPPFFWEEELIIALKPPKIRVDRSGFPNSISRAVGGLVRGNPAHYNDAHLRMVFLPQRITSNNNTSWRLSWFHPHCLIGKMVALKTMVFGGWIIISSWNIIIYYHVWI